MEPRIERYLEDLILNVHDWIVNTSHATDNAVRGISNHATFMEL